jgi:hypothetical protein
MVENVLKRFEYFKVVKMKLTGLHNYSICSMCGCWKHILPLLPLSFPEKENRWAEGKIGDLNGFEYMYLSDLKVPYFYCLSSISIKIISMGTTLFPSMARIALP